MHPDTLPCLAGCPAYGTRQGPLADDDVAPLETCARCLLRTEPGMACVHSPPYDDLPPAARPCRPVAPGGRLHAQDPTPDPQWDEKGKQHQSPG